MQSTNAMPDAVYRISPHIIRWWGFNSQPLQNFSSLLGASLQPANYLLSTSFLAIAHQLPLHTHILSTIMTVTTAEPDPVPELRKVLCDDSGDNLALRFRALFSLKHMATQGDLSAIDAIAAAFSSNSGLSTSVDESPDSRINKLILT